MGDCAGRGADLFESISAEIIGQLPLTLTHTPLPCSTPHTPLPCCMHPLCTHPYEPYPNRTHPATPHPAPSPLARRDAARRLARHIPAPARRYDGAPHAASATPLYLGTHTLYTLAHTPFIPWHTHPSYLGTHPLYTLARPSTTLPTHPPPGSLHDVPPAHPLDRHGGLLYRRAQHPREEERQRRALPTRPLTLTPTPAYPVHALAAPATCACSPCIHATRACSPMRHALAAPCDMRSQVVLAGKKSSFNDLEGAANDRLLEQD